jgi:molecular chaperone GrpE
MRRELDDAQKRGKEDLLRELLPVFDNLERAVVHAGQASDPKAVADGVAMVLKQFADTLGKIGIKRVPTVGSAFDPAQHEAIQQLETDDHPPGTIVAEVQPGYAMGDKLVRAAMVVVAKPSRKNGEGEKAEPN